MQSSNLHPLFFYIFLLSFIALYKQWDWLCFSCKLRPSSVSLLLPDRPAVTPWLGKRRTYGMDVVFSNRAIFICSWFWTATSLIGKLIYLFLFLSLSSLPSSGDTCVGISAKLGTTSSDQLMQLNGAINARKYAMNESPTLFIYLAFRRPTRPPNIHGFPCSSHIFQNAPTSSPVRHLRHIAISILTLKSRPR